MTADSSTTQHEDHEQAQRDKEERPSEREAKTAKLSETMGAENG
jgi:hypothetical protein